MKDKKPNVYEGIRRIVERDPRYQRAAYYFVFHALEHTLQKTQHQGHVSGQALLDGIREFAIDKFGFLAKTVFDSWGVHRTDDFGEIVFNLFEHDLMKRADTDRREDFSGRYDFEQVFEREFDWNALKLDGSN